MMDEGVVSMKIEETRDFVVISGIELPTVNEENEPENDCKTLTIEKSESGDWYYFTYHDGPYSRMGGHADKIILKGVDAGEFEVLYP